LSLPFRRNPGRGIEGTVSRRLPGIPLRRSFGDPRKLDSTIGFPRARVNGNIRDLLTDVTNKK